MQLVNIVILNAKYVMNMRDLCNFVQSKQVNKKLFMGSPYFLVALYDNSYGERDRYRLLVPTTWPLFLRVTSYRLRF
jgi:hypothetical protein